MHGRTEAALAAALPYTGQAFSEQNVHDVMVYVLDCDCLVSDPHACSDAVAARSAEPERPGDDEIPEAVEPATTGLPAGVSCEDLMDADEGGEEEAVECDQTVDTEKDID